jgi:hypothetical protein
MVSFVAVGDWLLAKDKSLTQRRKVAKVKAAN